MPQQTNHQLSEIGIKPGAAGRRDRVIGGHLSRLPDHALVVNVGCGIVRRFEAQCSGRYLATDLRVLPNVDFASDATRLPFVDHSVDAVLALELLEHVPRPGAVIEEIARVLKPGGTVIVSVPSTVPRHDDHDYWRYTAEGLDQLCTPVFAHGQVEVFGGTFETLGYLAEYYFALAFHAAKLPRRRFAGTGWITAVGFWADRHARWSSSTTALHTLAFDLLFVATADGVHPQADGQS